MADAGKPLDTNENVDIAIKVVQGKVLAMWPLPRTHIFFEPQACFDLAEHMARAAHRARFPGEPLSDDFHYLTQQIKQRLTDDLRNRLIIRVRTMLPSILERKDLNYAATQIVDTIFAAVDHESNQKL